MRDEEIEDTRLSPAEWRSLLEREGQLARRLTHPSVLRLFEAGTDGPYTFAGYELRRCFPIARELAHRRMAEEDALRAMRELGSALAHLHGEGVVYCNLHAHGVFMTADAKILLADLSMATAIGGPLHPLIGRNVFALSPEYLSGKGYEPSSDLFALGALAYEMLTGTRPFKGLDDYAIIEAVRWKIPRPPCEIDPAIGEATSDIVMRLLDKEPSDRFGSAGELMRELDVHSDG
jgi:serine/threonine-protein kinase